MPNTVLGDASRLIPDPCYQWPKTLQGEVVKSMDLGSGVVAVEYKPL